MEISRLSADSEKTSRLSVGLEKTAVPGLPVTKGVSEKQGAFPARSSMPVANTTEKTPLSMAFQTDEGTAGHGRVMNTASSESKEVEAVLSHDEPPGRLFQGNEMARQEEGAIQNFLRKGTIRSTEGSQGPEKPEAFSPPFLKTGASASAVQAAPFLTDRKNPTGEKKLFSEVLRSGHGGGHGQAPGNPSLNGAEKGEVDPVRVQPAPARDNGIQAVRQASFEVPQEIPEMQKAGKSRSQGPASEMTAVKGDFLSGGTPGKQDVPSPVMVNGRDMAARILEMRQALGNNSGRVTFSLQPPSLGTLTMNVRVRDHRVETVIVADSLEVHQVLRGNLETLRTALLEQGLKVDTLQVVWQEGPSNEGHNGSTFSSFREGGGFEQGMARSEPIETRDSSEALDSLPLSGARSLEGISIFA